MLGRVLGINVKPFFPVGYKYKTGIMSLAECNNNPNIIPLTLKTRAIAPGKDSSGLNVIAGTVILADVSYVGGAWINIQRANINVDFLSAFNFDFKRLINECKPVLINSSSIYTGDITSWLEKVGG